MRFQLFSIIATLLATAQATPTPSLEARSSVNKCGDSDFINQSSSGSPLIADCQQIARNIAGGGTWTVDTSGKHHQLVEHETCAFGVKGDESVGWGYLGNQDIIDLINDSINKFSWQGKVGAKGTMNCQGSVSSKTFHWGIYHQ